ncbi:LysR family transcriptional regulator [Betaproteobacteria bacterium GR16-43]|nr:LysR family transcriptional regulator [Betaproteobacteria bacterium GR16-43]
MDRLQALRTLIAIVDAGSLSAASERLETSLPTVVRTLAALEGELGVRLINRTTRRMHLTDEGRVYVERSRAIVAALAEADGELAARKGTPQGRVAVTASVSFGRRYLSPFVAEFMRRYPAVTFDLLLVDRIVDLVEEGIDVGIRIGALRDSSLIAQPVGRMRRVLCASPEYLKKHGTPKSPGDLSRHRCIAFTPLSSDTAWTFGSGRTAQTVPIRSVLRCNQVDGAVEACRAGLGIGTFLSYQVAPLVAEKRLRYVMTAHEPPPVPMNVVYQHRKLASAALKRFVDECTAALRVCRFE